MAATTDPVAFQQAAEAMWRREAARHARTPDTLICPKCGQASAKRGRYWGSSEVFSHCYEYRCADSDCRFSFGVDYDVLAPLEEHGRP